ncbi:MAG: hypothetical protein JWP22_1536, partial [Ramlibacter sp.]|nr:hypothetical protein [Ramlibacter sp.]
EELERRVKARGATMAALDLRPGTRPLDRYVDVPPYRAHPHLVLSMEGYAATSAGIIIHAPAA